MSKILVIRFSAIGDVAMTIPIVYSLARQYPEHQITVLSRDFLAPLFQTAPSNICFMGIDLKGRHRGIVGLSRLFKELRVLEFDYVADLHDVLRSKYLRLRLQFSGIVTASIDKGKSGKRKLVRRYFKIFKQQKTSFDRYEKVFAKLGFPLILDFVSVFQDENNQRAFSLIESLTGRKTGQKWLGIAPFAKHRGKIYPSNLLEQAIDHFARKDGFKLFLFGAGKEEESQFARWVTKYPNSVCRLNKLDMNAELALMSQLDAMVSMDSANMHLASLVGTPVLSIWGATHPYAGFMGWKQPFENAIQIDLRCRPCSVFGQKPCYRGDYACLNRILPDTVIRKIEQVVYLKSEDQWKT